VLKKWRERDGAFRLVAVPENWESRRKGPGGAIPSQVWSRRSTEAGVASRLGWADRFPVLKRRGAGQPGRRRAGLTFGDFLTEDSKL
jgi:hypothetical protein